MLQKVSLAAENRYQAKQRSVVIPSEARNHHHPGY